MLQSEAAISVFNFKDRIFCMITYIFDCVMHTFEQYALLVCWVLDIIIIMKLK